MATPLDIGLLKAFNVVFPFLFVLVVVYAVLTRIKAFEAPERKGLAALIALALAIITMTSHIAVKTLTTMAPWFVLLFVFIVLMLVAYQIFGVEEKTIVEIVLGKTEGKWGSTFFQWMIALILIIGLGSLATVISQERGFQSLTTGENGTVVQAPQNATTGEAGEFFRTLTHPRVLGLVLILLIAMFTVKYMMERPIS
jgi:hypothetical protein